MMMAYIHVIGLELLAHVGIAGIGREVEVFTQNLLYDGYDTGIGQNIRGEVFFGIGKGYLEMSREIIVIEANLFILILRTRTTAVPNPSEQFYTGHPIPGVGKLGLSLPFK